jgi:hypothetical protein
VAKTTGLGDNFYVGGYDLSGDTASLGKISGGPAALNVTSINDAAYERLGGLRDGGIDWVSYFNGAAAHAHAALSPLPTADVICTYFRGTAIGNPAASIVAKQVNYDPTRDNAGNLTEAVSAQANAYGLEWGTQLTAGLRTDTSATNGTSFDFSAASPSFGAQAYLQVTAFSGTDVTIKLQDSANNSSFSDVTGGGFTQVTTAPGAQRIATAANLQIREYVRVATVTSGGFSSVTFAVMIAVNPVAVVF